MKTNKLLLVVFLTGALLSCGGGGGGNTQRGLADGASGDLEAYESGNVNAVVQALPTIMVIPGDQTLQTFKSLNTETVNGRSYVIRDFQKYLLKDYRARRIISTIQEAFIDQGFPLSDFEQTLKQLNTQEALDMADGVDKDAKTLLLFTAHPDIILEMNYFSSRDKGMSMTSHNYTNKGKRDISYTLTALDAYTNKSVATINAVNIKNESTTEGIQDDLKEQLPKFQQDIQNYFSDILTRGREITVRIALEKGCRINLSDESIEGDTYTDWIIDYMKSHTIKGAYKMQNNTDKEINFTNCRIKLLNEDGTQYGVYDWTRDFAKNLHNNLGLIVANKAQGLGEVLLVIKDQ